MCSGLMRRRRRCCHSPPRARGSIALERGGGLPVSLGALVRDRIDALPAEARRALCAAAALSVPTLTLVGAVCEGELGPAAVAGVVELDGDLVRFAHPLLRSAAYAGLPAGERPGPHRPLPGGGGERGEEAWQPSPAD